MADRRQKAHFLKTAFHKNLTEFRTWLPFPFIFGQKKVATHLQRLCTTNYNPMNIVETGGKKSGRKVGGLKKRGLHLPHNKSVSIFFLILFHNSGFLAGYNPMHISGKIRAGLRVSLFFCPDDSVRFFSGGWFETQAENCFNLFQQFSAWARLNWSHEHIQNWSPFPLKQRVVSFDSTKVNRRFSLSNNKF